MTTQAVRTDEKRRFPRVPAQHILSFARMISGVPAEPLTSLARTLDIGAGGLRLESDRALTIGDQLHLELALGSQIVHAEATVVHQRPVQNELVEAGLMFDRVPASDRETLTALGFAA